MTDFKLVSLNVRGVRSIKMKIFGIRSGKAKCYFHMAHTIARAPWY